LGKKTVKISTASGALPPEPLFTSHGCGFFALKEEKNNYNKCSAFASFAILHLFFTLNSVVFVDVGARIFLAPGRRVP